MSDKKYVQATIGDHTFSVHADSEAAGLKAIQEHASGLGLKGEATLVAPAPVAAEAPKTASTTTSGKK